MKRITFSTLIASLLVLSTTSCKKDSENAPDVDLRNKTVKETKSMLIGNWKIHYAYGGLDGHTKQSFANSTFRILPNDSIFFSSDNGLTSNDKVVYEKTNTMFGYEATVMNFTSHLDWVVSKQKGDTLILKDHATEPFEYYITRIPELKN